MPLDLLHEVLACFGDGLVFRVVSGPGFEPATPACVRAEVVVLVVPLVHRVHRVHRVHHTIWQVTYIAVLDSGPTWQVVEEERFIPPSRV